jgi:hypothetical protein
MTVDPSPPAQAEAELQVLSRTLEALELTPFPESEYKEPNDDP